MDRGLINKTRIVHIHNQTDFNLFFDKREYSSENQILPANEYTRIAGNGGRGEIPWVTNYDEFIQRAIVLYVIDKVEDQEDNAKEQQIIGYIWQERNIGGPANIVQDFIRFSNDEREGPGENGIDGDKEVDGGSCKNIIITYEEPEEDNGSGESRFPGPGGGSEAQFKVRAENTTCP